jgi:prepilin-type N-terminal cleavage/methylation domain-containing protein
MPAERTLFAVRSVPPIVGESVCRHRRASGDGGFSLVEVLVAIAVIGTVMAAVAPFLVQSVVVVGQQRSQQVAVQVANDALERARALRPTSLLVGRDIQATVDQWAVGIASSAVLPYLTGMAQASDPAALPGAGITAPLPTSPYPVTIGGVEYQQNWYIGRCWQAKADPTQVKVTVAGCLPASTNITDVSFFKIVVAVTWQQKSCAGRCVYVASTLVSNGVDATFDLNQPPPTITDPASQTGYVSVAASLQILAPGGQPPMTWTATGLPPGLSISLGGGLISGTPTAAGAYTVVVKVTDSDLKTDDSTFTWTVIPLPTLTSPGDQTGEIGVAVTLPLTVSPTVPPLTWSATGLPAGISINSATGVLSGTPTVVRAFSPVTVTVVDPSAPIRTTSVTFNWRVLAAVQLTNIGAQSMTVGTNVGTFVPPVSGGLTPYSWQGTNLPDGVLINATTGSVTGVVRSGTRYITTVTVTDSLGGTAVLTVVCNVSGSGDLRVTNPLPSNPDRSTAVNTVPALLAPAAAGGTPAYTWAATNLPTGLTLNSAGVLAGKPTAKGSYVVTLTVSGPSTKIAILMFTWTVT